MWWGTICLITLSIHSAVGVGASIATNCRLTVHLPLVIPPHCALQVGNHVRAWTPGELLIFDDTIEHAAWNDSDQPRAVLILDTWNPLLTEAERELVTALTAGVGEYYGDLPNYASGAPI